MSLGSPPTENLQPDLFLTPRPRSLSAFGGPALSLSSVFVAGSPSAARGSPPHFTLNQAEGLYPEPGRRAPPKCKRQLRSNSQLPLTSRRRSYLLVYGRPARCPLPHTAPLENCKTQGPQRGPNNLALEMMAFLMYALSQDKGQATYLSVKCLNRNSYQAKRTNYE